MGDHSGRQKVLRRVKSMVLPVGFAQFARIRCTGQHKLRRSRYQRRAENVPDRQHLVGEAEGHGRCARTVFPPSPWRRFAQRLVWAGQVVSM